MKPQPYPLPDYLATPPLYAIPTLPLPVHIFNIFFCPLYYFAVLCYLLLAALITAAASITAAVVSPLRPYPPRLANLLFLSRYRPFPNPSPYPPLNRSYPPATVTPFTRTNHSPFARQRLAAAIFGALVVYPTLFATLPL